MELHFHCQDTGTRDLKQLRCVSSCESNRSLLFCCDLARFMIKSPHCCVCSIAELFRCHPWAQLAAHWSACLSATLLFHRASTSHVNYCAFWSGVQSGWLRAKKKKQVSGWDLFSVVSPAVVQGHGALREGKHCESNGCKKGTMKGRLWKSREIIYGDMIQRQSGWGFFFMPPQGSDVVTCYDHRLDAKRRHVSSLPVQSVAWDIVPGT